MGKDSVNEEGKRLALDVLGRRRAELLSRMPQEEIPDSSFYAFLKQTRKKYFSTYLDSLRDAVETGDTTDFLGNETFQSYSHARNGFSLRQVLEVPMLVKTAARRLIGDLVVSGEAGASESFAAGTIICELLDEAESIRAQAFIQTRDENIRFFHSYQEEIDRFPSNLAATLDFSTLMGSALKKCIELIDVGRCAFLTRDLVTNELHLKASNFAHERVFGDGAVMLDEQIVEKIVRDREPVLVEGYRRALPLVTGLMKRMRTKVLLIVPLMVRDRNAGVMILDNVERPQMFTPDVINLAMRYANKVAAAMENARLHGSEQQKLKETMALLEVSRLVTSTLDMDELLSRLVQITADVCEVGKCTVYLYLSDSGRFYPTATFGVFPDSQWEMSLGEGIQPQDMTDEDIETIIEQHRVALSDPHLSPFMPSDRIEDTAIRSVVSVPVFSREHMLGLIVLFHGKDRDELDAEDLHLVTAIAGQAAVALENASLYEDLELSYFSTVKALARAIEVKDPYTYGHSERVTDYALAIARKLGVSEWDAKNIKYAAALHDIGKIGIARKILDKPGALSDEEFIHIKTHPLLGDSIIEPVAFLAEPREIILHHHERWDGKGYPDGLKGDEIPLGARILAVADSFEAMMSDRPYRKALPIEEATSELEANAGSQFDPKVISAFLEVIGEGEITLTQQEPSPQPTVAEDRESYSPTRDL